MTKAQTTSSATNELFKKRRRLIATIKFIGKPKRRARGAGTILQSNGKWYAFVEVGEKGEPRKRKKFTGSTRKEVEKKMKPYVQGVEPPTQRSLSARSLDQLEMLCRRLEDGGTGRNRTAE